MDKHYIDKRFREELEGLEANPPVETWLTISDALDEKALAGRKYVLMRTAAAIAVFVVAAFSLWMIFVDQSLREDPVVQQTAPANIEAIPSTGLPQTENSLMLLADLSRSSTMDHHRFVLPQPQSTYDHATPWSIQSFSAEVPRSVTPGVLDSRNLKRNDQARMDMPVRDVHMFMESAEKKAYASNLNLGAHFALQYNYRAFANQSGGSYRSIPFNALESQIYTFSAGLNATLALSNGWALQTGLHLNNMGQFIEGISAYQHPDHKSIYRQNQIVITSLGGVTVHDTSHHFSDQSSHRVLDPDEYLDPKVLDALLKSNEGLTQVLQFVEVPLIFRYKLIGQRVNLHLKGGMAASYLLNKDVYIGSSINRHPIGQTHGLRQLNFSLVGGLALQYPLAGQLYLQLEPTAQLFLRPIRQDGLNTGNVLPYNFSLQTGVSYRF